MTTTLQKQVSHLGVRFYRSGGVELVLVPLLAELASFVRGAGDGYFLVVLSGEPGTAYPVHLGTAAAFDPDYLGDKFKLDRRGYGVTPDELAAVLRLVAADLHAEGARER